MLLDISVETYKHFVTQITVTNYPARCLDDSVTPVLSLEYSGCLTLNSLIVEGIGKLHRAPAVRGALLNGPNSLGCKLIISTMFCSTVNGL